ncbi:MAG: hypothetical protein ACOCYE_11045, partial [Pseudomonadota bacterium]
MMVDGVPRPFCLHVPTSTPVPPDGLPVVFAFHGATGTADGVAMVDHLTEQGTILVAPIARAPPRGSSGGCRRAW